MIGDYYQRTTTQHLDGSPIFKTEQDEGNEREVAAIVESVWSCQLGSFGRLAVIDWYASRNERLVSLLELKTRTHDSLRYETVFLNVRKWLALTLGSIGLGVPALFVVKFTDGVRWINISEVDPSDSRIGGCARIVKSRNDREPVIEIPVAQMKVLA